MEAKAFFMTWTGRLKSPTELRGYWSRAIAIGGPPTSGSAPPKADVGEGTMPASANGDSPTPIAY